MNAQKTRRHIVTGSALAALTAMSLLVPAAARADDWEDGYLVFWAKFVHSDTWEKDPKSNGWFKLPDRSRVYAENTVAFRKSTVLRAPLQIPQAGWLYQIRRVDVEPVAGQRLGSYGEVQIHAAADNGQWQTWGGKAEFRNLFVRGKHDKDRSSHSDDIFWRGGADALGKRTPLKIDRDEEKGDRASTEPRQYVSVAPGEDRGGRMLFPTTTTLLFYLVPSDRPTRDLTRLHEKIAAAGPVTVTPQSAPGPGLPGSPGAISGTVRSAQTGRALAGAVVTAQPSRGQRRTVTTGQDGRFAFPQLPPGRCEMTISRNGYAPDTQIVQILPGRETPIVSDLRPPVVPVGAVFGRVVDAQTGRGLAGARVSARVPGAAGGPVTTTAADGSFALAAVPSGRTLLSVEMPGYLGVANEVTVPAGGQVRLDLTLAAPVQATGALRGQVVDAWTGRAIRGAEVRTAAVAGRAAQTDHNGNYTVDQVAPGTHVVTVSHRDYRTETQQVEIRAARTTEANFRLVPSAAQAERARLAISSATLAPGQRVSLPVTLLDLVRLGDLNLTLRYPAELELVQCLRGNLPGNTVYDANTGRRGVVEIAVVNQRGIDGRIELCRLELRLNPQHQGSIRQGDRFEIDAKVTSAHRADTNAPVVFAVTRGVVTAGGGANGPYVGDCNQDGRVTAVDVMVTLQMSTGNVASQGMADVDGDGRVTALDARLIADMAVGARPLQPWQGAGVPDAPDTDFDDRDLQRAYDTYMAAYERLSRLIDAGRGETAEGRQAYEEYERARAAYERALERQHQ